jgi:hypothetical protein
MNIGLRRVVLASTLVVAVTAAGVVPGAVASEPGSARDGAAAVLELHEELAEAAAAGDVPAMRWALAELTPLLDELERGERYALPDSGRQLAADASAELSTVKEQIEPLLSQRDVPSIPVLLNMLLQQLLKLLADLINNLLGGGVPLPA